MRPLKLSRLGRRFLKDRHFTDAPSSPKLPSLNLLAVNKQIFEETAPILYGKNTWRMPAVAGGKLFPWRDHNVFVRHAKLFRHISVKFDRRNMKDIVFYGHPYYKVVRKSKRYPQPGDRFHWLMRALLQRARRVAIIATSDISCHGCG